jgi:hypothetical protein
LTSFVLRNQQKEQTGYDQLSMRWKNLKLNRYEDGGYMTSLKHLRFALSTISPK